MDTNKISKLLGDEPSAKQKTERPFEIDDELLGDEPSAKQKTERPFEIDDELLGDKPSAKPKRERPFEIDDAWYYSHQDVGEVKIAGIFNVHLKGNLGKGYFKRCGIIDPQYGIMFVEAMLFALDRINNDTSILHGLKLRTRIYDTCGDKLYLRNILVQVANYHSQGVVGPQYSDDAITTATVMNIFGKNTISYAATSPDLENRIRYGYFYRTVPSDYNAVKLLVSLALKFKWNYIALISSEGNYGQRSSDLFRDSATKQGICIPIDMTISEDAKTGDYEYILQMIRKQSAIKIQPKIHEQCLSFLQILVHFNQLLETFNIPSKSI
eukprot:gene3831-15124_t